MLLPVPSPQPWASLPLNGQLQDLHQIVSLLTDAVRGDEALIGFPLTGLDGPGDGGVGGGSGDQAHGHVYQETLSGTGTGPYTLASTPVPGSEVLHYGTLELLRVASSPGLNEYTISGTTITLGFSKDPALGLYAAYEISGITTHGHVYAEPIAGSGAGPFTLAATPLAGTDRLVYATLHLVRVVSGPGLNEYTISGNSVTLGFSKEASQPLLAHYDV